MRHKFILILALFSAAAFSRTGFVNPDSLPDAIAKTAQALMETHKHKSRSMDSVTGSCEYKEGTCNGAEVSLLKAGEKIFSTTITSNSEFHIPRLKKNEDYELVLSWKKHNLYESRKVTPGEFISIKLTSR